MKLSTILGAAVLGIAPLAASATTIYTQNFEGLGTLPTGLPTGWIGPGQVESVQSYPLAVFGTAFLRNTSGGNPAPGNTLLLVGLAPHSTVDLSFDLATIDSWDGGTGASTSPNGDFFNVNVDGTLVFSKSFSNGLGEPGTFGGAPDAQGNFGFDANYSDGAYHISFTGIAHTGSSLAIQFFASGPGWQGGSDESFAIDNVVVGTANGAAVPTPAAFGGGVMLAGVMVVARRRKA